jgi:hypothetical protein
MSENSTSPGRRRALQLSGDKIKTEIQHAAPDGHMVGPGAVSTGEADKPLLDGVSAPPASVRRLPFAARKS